MKLILENFKPTENRLLVKIAEKEEVTRGGIIIPDTAKEKPHYGFVVKAGPGLKDPGIDTALYKDGRISMDISVGDSVLFNKYSGIELEIENQDYVLIKESDVLAII